MFTSIGTGIGLLAALLAVLEIGHQLGRRAQATQSGAAANVGAIQGATLGLLGLLLGFSFAGAAARFIERQDLIVEEANAIGTAYLRADLVDDPHAAKIRRILAEYVRHRVEVSKTLAGGVRSEQMAQVAQFHKQLWEAARDGVRASPAVTLAVVDPVNQVIDLHSTRIAAGRKHLPVLVLGLLIGCSMLAMMSIGYGSGMVGRRSILMSALLAILIAAALWITIDLDHPRAGLLRLSDAPLEQLELNGSP